MAYKKLLINSHTTGVLNRQFGGSLYNSKFMKAANTPKAGVGAQVAVQSTAMLGSSIISNNEDSSVDKFGNAVVDEKAMANKNAMSGMATGAAIGGTIGSVIPGIGTAIGTVGGAVVGGVAGLIGGKKKAKAASTEYNKTYTSNTRGENRNRDMAMSAALYGKNGLKITASKSIIRRDGGKLEDRNIIPEGKLHKENNSLGNKDKGIPVVDNGEKIFELEKEELVLRQEASKELERLTAEYNANPTPEKLEALGKYMHNELVNNTDDKSGTYKKKT